MGVDAGKFSRANICLFLVGLGAATKVYFLGTIAISELVAFCVAPYLFIVDYKRLKDDGFMPMVWITCLVVMSMLISSWKNGTAMPYVIKSFAVLYSIFAHFVIFHRLLRNNYRGLGYFLTGAVISALIAIFAFNPTAMVSEEGVVYIGDQEVEDIINGPLFYVHKVVPVFKLPISAIYLQTPITYSVVTLILSVILVVTTSVSGRSASLVMLLSVVLIFAARKSRNKMSRLGRHYILFLFLMSIVAVAGKTAYKYAALNGYLDEDARVKYEQQTQGKDSILALLMGGRKEFFAAIPAALDKPILGHGPFAKDTNGYWEKFFSRYGDYDDLKLYYKQWARSGGNVMIPTHSHLMGFWVHYGIGGLIFWVYVVAVIVLFLRKYMGVVPQWYGYFAMSLTKFAWDLFFSPFSGRCSFALLMCCIFFARALGERKLILPFDMEVEARKYE